MQLSFFSSKFQLIVNMKRGETGPLAQNHAMVENRPDREESKLLLRLGEQNALEIARKHNLAIPKNAPVCMHLSFSLKKYGNINVFILDCHIF